VLNLFSMDYQRRITVGQSCVHEQPCMRKQLCMQGLGVAACFLLECCYLFYISGRRYCGSSKGAAAATCYCSHCQSMPQLLKALRHPEHDHSARGRKEGVACCTFCKLRIQSRSIPYMTTAKNPSTTAHPTVGG
jgi:hypothetical protein